MSGFAHRLAYVRWLRSRGRVKLENDAEFAAWLGVGRPWLVKWKGRNDAPDRLTEAAAVARALTQLGTSIDWLYKGVGTAPEPDLWKQWTEGGSPRRGVSKRTRKPTTDLDDAATRKRGRG